MFVLSAEVQGLLNIFESEMRITINESVTFYISLSFCFSPLIAVCSGTNSIKQIKHIKKLRHCHTPQSYDIRTIIVSSG